MPPIPNYSIFLRAVIQDTTPTDDQIGPFEIHINPTTGAMQLRKAGDDAFVALGGSGGPLSGTRLTLSQGAIVADQPQIDGSVTWNNAGILGPAWKLNVTDSGSDAAALLLDLQVAGSPKFRVDKTGKVFIGGTAEMIRSGGGYIDFTINNAGSAVLMRQGTSSQADFSAGLRGLYALATVAGGHTIAPLAMGSAGIGIFFGSGVPTISAPQGSLYIRSDGSSTSTRLYVNTNGTTGWTNFTSAT